jgi:hypothetical protein
MKQLLITLSLLLGYHLLNAQSYTNVRYTYDNAGNRISRYKVQTYNKKGASDTVVSSNNITENNLQSSIGSVYITVYPNPAYNKLFIDLQQIKTDTGINYSLTDLFGKTIIKNQTNNSTLQIDLSEVASGIYLLHIKSENFEAIHKINKLHQ